MTQGRLRLDDPVTCVRGIGEAKALQLERLKGCIVIAAVFGFLFYLNAGDDVVYKE